MNLLYAVLLAAVGLAAVVIEMFVPAAGLIGIIGAGCIVTGVSLSFIHYGAVTGSVFLLAVLVISPWVIFLWFRHFPRSFAGRALILFNPEEKPAGRKKGKRKSEALSDTVNPPAAPPGREMDSLPGREGTAFTDLRPSGMILIEGIKYSALTAGEYISRDSRIRVVKVNGNRIEVREEE